MRGVMAPCLSVGGILAVLSLVALSNAGPLGPLPNVTSSEVGLKEGSCVLGDVVYMSGDTFAGATPCDHCACAAGSVQCTQERCEPRPGCKALHRPDHCCPTYQCECEQEGRVYGNGEKLVDPEDPCRVCYCQGGEVVCRRIACFLRDDCQPRLVPGRCCPEYDNCPLRGITSIPGLTPPVSSISTTENIDSSPAPTPPKESIRQEITIKEITPVSEIPVITDVRIKEILPSPSIEVPEYPSSKSPLIPREAIPDNTVTSSAEISPKTEESVVIEMISPLIPTELSSKPAEKNTADMLPSKISLSTQDSINSEIYPSHIPTIIATMGVSPLTPDSIPVASTARVAIIEEEDIDHNPAFPPIPDDFVFGTHGDESLSEPNADNDHITNVHGEQHVAGTLSPPASTMISREIPTTTARTTPAEISTTTTTTEKQITEATSVTARTPENIDRSTAYVLTSTTVRTEVAKGSSMLDIRTAIPNDILNLPSTIPEDITGDLDDPEESVTAFEEPLYIVTSTTTEPVTKIVYDTTIPPQIVSKNNILPRSSEKTKAPFETSTETTHSATSTTTASGTKSVDETTITPQIIVQNKILPRSSEVINTPFDTITETTHSATFSPTESVTKLEDETTVAPQIIAKNKVLPRSSEVTNAPFDTTTQTTQKITEAPEISTTKVPEELTTIAVSKSKISTEITSQTEFSSLPIETSDQNPQYSSESMPKEKTTFTTKAPLNTEITTDKETTEHEEVTVTRANPTSPSTPEIYSFENVETTEFVLTSFASSEGTTDTVEVIKISPTQKVRNAAVIDSASGKKTNVLTDLINLVGDVASISKHTDAPEATLRTTTSNSFSDSEELMPVNAGYKSKNSNFNLNSITEIPLKSKNQLPVNKQKVVEIQEEVTDSIADAPPPHDKVEPTTRRPIIDNVSDSMPKNETEKKDIEIISQSYVPTINRRPTKVVMKKNKDKPLAEASTEGPTLSVVSSDRTTFPDDLNASPVIVTESGFASGELGTTVDPTVGADTTTTAQ